jgi:uncharacterized membrane protein YeaQ/YmgE (transglycosylase-associated protein family)
MNPVEFILILLTSIICGAFAQLTSGFSKGGWIINLLIGFFGALAGVYLSRAFNAPVLYNLRVSGVNFPIVYCVVGSVLFLAAITLVTNPSRR